MLEADALRRNYREFEFSPRDFAAVQRLIYKHAGIKLTESKEDMVYSRLARRLRARGLTRFVDYLAIVEAGDEKELEAFTNSLTTNLTSFFREPHHFEVLAAQLRQRRADDPVTIWCCASSTGEEPYSIAITLAECLGQAAARARILASDVDTNVLATAEHGVYAMDRVNALPPERLHANFLRGRGDQSGKVRVREELRRMVTYRRINLLDADWPVRGPFDAIFCRNVMIYFDKPTQRGILDRFAPLLRGDGLLFVGHSESLYHMSDVFHARGHTVYERAGR